MQILRVETQGLSHWGWWWSFSRRQLLASMKRVTLTTCNLRMLRLSKGWSTGASWIGSTFLSESGQIVRSLISAPCMNNTIGHSHRILVGQWCQSNHTPRPTYFHSMISFPDSKVKDPLLQAPLAPLSSSSKRQLSLCRHPRSSSILTRTKWTWFLRSMQDSRVSLMYRLF